MHYRSIIVIEIILSCAAAVFAAEIDEVDREISRLKKEIARVQSQRSDELQQARKERMEFQKYCERIAEKSAAIKLQTDSIGNELQKVNLRNDSLKTLLSSIASRLQEQDLQRKRLREKILDAARMLKSEIAGYTPLVVEQYEGTVNYLISEIESGSIEHPEALYRLMRIFGDIRTLSQEIQTVETASPVSQLRGTVYRLRIGLLFEAVVDVNGSKAFIWNREANTQKEKWVAASQEDVVSIFTAVRIRDGKTIPELVRLPFGAPPSLPGEGE